MQKWHKMGTDLHPQPIQEPQTLSQHQRQQAHTLATHTSPKPSRKHRPNTWCASAHRNGLLLFRSAGRRCRCGSLSEQSEPAQERLGSRQRCSRMSGAEQKFRQRVKKQWCNPQDKKGEGQETPKAMHWVNLDPMHRASSDGGAGSTAPL